MKRLALALLSLASLLMGCCSATDNAAAPRVPKSIPEGAYIYPQGIIDKHHGRVSYLRIHMPP